MRTFTEGDLVACYLTNTNVIEELLVWGIVLQVQDTLEDVLVLDNLGNKNWYPSRRWRPLIVHRNIVDIKGVLA